MTSLVDFLLARIAEDEEIVAYALAAVDADRTEYAATLARRTGQLWTVTNSGHCGQSLGPRGSVEATPGRVLAECEAKRQLVERFSDRVEVTEMGSAEKQYLTGAEDTGSLRLLALPYADHPDYDTNWQV